MPYDENIWESIDSEEQDFDFNQDFPAGTYVGEIESVPFDALSDWEASDGETSGKSLTVQLANNKGLNGTADVGPLRHRLRMTTQINGVDCWDYENAEDEKHQGQLRMGFVFLAKLATALGMRESGDSNNAVIEQAVEMLSGDTFHGQKVQFRVYHTPKDKNDPKAGVWVNTAPKSIKAPE